VITGSARRLPEERESAGEWLRKQDSRNIELLLRMYHDTDDIEKEIASILPLPIAEEIRDHLFSFKD
jgi:hypothetical protein